MRKPSKAVLLAAAAAFLALSAGAKVLEDVVARVNGKPLLLSEYNKNVRSVLDNYQRSMPQLLREEEVQKEIRKKVLDQMIDDELLAQDGEKSAIKITERELTRGIEEIQERSFRVDEMTGKRRSDFEVKKSLADELEREGLSEEQFRERIRRQILMRKVVEEKVRPLVKEPDEKKVQAAFDKLQALRPSEGLKEELGAAKAVKIIAVADVVEAMATHRPYRPALGVAAALDEIRMNRGTLYEPSVVDSCLNVFERGFLFPLG